MNAWLANTFGTINAFVAIVIIIIGGMVGQIIGLLIGALAAVLFCGFFAIILDMKRIMEESHSTLRATLRAIDALNEAKSK